MRGRSGSRWRALCTQIKTRRDPCYWCGQPIDYDATYPADASFTVDHLKPLSLHPELAEDPSNLVACHAKCNKVKGASTHLHLSLGNLSEQW
jgi:5-methylcytosine-specific restriction endonuclease McrA